MSIKVIRITENLLEENDRTARENERTLDRYGICSFNLMGSPGSGKTKILERLISKLNKDFSCAVIEGDIAGTLDSERLKKFNIPLVQINTEGGCHLQAFMIKKGMDILPLEKIKIIFVENVGNLVCPAEVSLGVKKNIVVSSVTEGDDKPAKYPLMYKISHLCLVNKVDIHQPEDYDIERFTSYVKKINPLLKIIPVSAKTGQNIDNLVSWIKNQI